MRGAIASWRKCQEPRARNIFGMHNAHDEMLEEDSLCDAVPYDDDDQHALSIEVGDRVECSVRELLMKHKMCVPYSYGSRRGSL